MRNGAGTAYAASPCKHLVAGGFTAPRDLHQGLAAEATPIGLPVEGVGGRLLRKRELQGDLIAAPKTLAESIVADPDGLDPTTSRRWRVSCARSTQRGMRTATALAVLLRTTSLPS